MQMEQAEEQKTISNYREEHQNIFRNELRNKFIQKSRQKHFNNINQPIQSEQIQYSQLQQQQQQQQYQQHQMLNDFQRNGSESIQEQQGMRTNAQNIQSNGQEVNQHDSMNQEHIIEERESRNGLQCEIGNIVGQEIKQQQQQQQQRGIEYMDLSSSVELLLNSNDLAMKIQLLQHITDLVENSMQDLMDFSFVLQNHTYLLDILKNYIQQHQHNTTHQSPPNHIQNKSYNTNLTDFNTVGSHQLEQQCHQNNDQLMWAINLVSLIAYTKQEDVVALIRKGFVEVLMNIFMEQNQNIRIAEKIICFFANVISIDEVMKTVILNNIPIKLFLFYFINDEYHQPSYLDFHQILSLFLNKCYLQSDYSNNNNNNNNNENEDNPVMQSLIFIFNSVIKDFLAALGYFIMDMQVSINLSEILTYICSNILKTYPIHMIKLHLNEIKHLINLQIKSTYKPLQIQSIKLMSKIFQVPNILQEFDDEAKNFIIQTLKDSLNCEMKQIRINSITAIINLLQNVHDDQLYTHIIQFLYHSIFDRFQNDTQQIKLLCLDFFFSVIKHCSTSQNVSIDWKLKMGDQIFVSLIDQLRKSNLDASNANFILKILNLLSSIIGILNSNPFKHKFQLNYIQESGILEALNSLQQQNQSYEIKTEAQMILQLFYSVSNQK